MKKKRPQNVAPDVSGGHTVHSNQDMDVQILFYTPRGFQGPKLLGPSVDVTTRVFYGPPSAFGSLAPGCGRAHDASKGNTVESFE